MELWGRYMRMRGRWAPKHRVTGSDRVGKPRRQNTICSVMASGSSKSNNVVTAPGCESWQALHAIPWCLAGECSTGMQLCEISQGCLFRYRTGRWRTASSSGYNQRAFCTAAKNECGVTHYDKTRLPHIKTQQHCHVMLIHEHGTSMKTRSEIYLTNQSYPIMAWWRL